MRNKSMMSTVEPPSSDTPSSDKTPPSSEQGSRKRWLGLVLLVVVVAATVAGRLVDAPDVIATAQQALREVGPWASVVFAAVYIVATLLGFPGTPLTLACALMFGFWKAFIIMVIATTLASSIAFLVARYVARDSIERWLGDDSRLGTAKGWVERSPWLAIPFMRVMPVFPYAINNYGLGLTQTPFWTYLLASSVAMIPSNALLVGFANSLYAFAIRGETPWWMFAATIGAGLAILLFGWLGKRVLSSQ